YVWRYSMTVSSFGPRTRQPVAAPLTSTTTSSVRLETTRTSFRLPSLRHSDPLALTESSSVLASTRVMKKTLKKPRNGPSEVATALGPSAGSRNSETTPPWARSTFAFQVGDAEHD